MINPLNYLFYKIMKALSYISGEELPIGYIAAFAIFPIINIWTVYLLITGKTSNIFFIGTVVLVAIFNLIYFSPKRASAIMEKYENESIDSKVLGNIIVTLYIILSIVSFILAMKH